MGTPPIDKGWAWFCVLGCHICNFFLIGGFKTLGILFVEFNAEFTGSKAATATMVGVIAGSMAMFAPIATALGEYYTERWVVISGGILVFLGSFITSFATNMSMIIFGFGITTGFGYGCMLGPSLVLIGKYFRKRRSFASGLSIAGGSMGQLFIPLLLRYLIDEYQWRGGLFIYSALILNVIVGASLFRPLSFYSVKRKPVRPSNTDQMNNGVHNQTRGNNRSDDGLGELKAQSTPNLVLTLDDGKTDMPMENDGFLEEAYVNGRKTRSTASLHRNNGHVRDARVQRLLTEEGLDYSKMLYSSTGSIMFAPITFRDNEVQPAATEITDSEIERPNFLKLLKGSFCCCLNRKDKDQVSLFDWSLFKRPIFIMFLVALSAGNVGYVNLFLLIPPHSEDMGLTRNKAAILVSVAGVSDLLARVFGGWFADLGYVKKNIIMAGSMLLSAVSTFILPRLNSFESMLIYSIIIGVTGGSYAAQMIVILIDYVGLARTAKAFGLTIMTMGCISIPAPILLAHLREVTGNWLLSFTFCGIAMSICSVCFFSERWVKKLDEKFS